MLDSTNFGKMVGVSFNKHLLISTKISFYYLLGFKVKEEYLTQEPSVHESWTTDC